MRTSQTFLPERDLLRGHEPFPAHRVERDRDAAVDRDFRHEEKRNRHEQPDLHDVILEYAQGGRDATLRIREERDRQPEEEGEDDDSDDGGSAVLLDQPDGLLEPGPGPAADQRRGFLIRRSHQNASSRPKLTPLVPRPKPTSMRRFTFSTWLNLNRNPPPNDVFSSRTRTSTSRDPTSPTAANATAPNRPFRGNRYSVWAANSTSSR